MFLLLAVFVATSCFSEDKQADNNEETPELKEGHLFIIGGGDRPDSLMTQYLALGGGSKARVLIVPFTEAIFRSAYTPSGRYYHFPTPMSDEAVLSGTPLCFAG